MTVTASFDASQAPQDAAQRLQAWVEESDGRTFTVDHSIPPVRWTVTADYLVDAPTAQHAERTAVDHFAADASRAGIPPAETVLASTGPLS